MSLSQESLDRREFLKLLLLQIRERVKEKIRPFLPATKPTEKSQNHPDPSDPGEKVISL